MSFKEYMSEVLKYGRVTLGFVEKHFLNEIIEGPKSAYEIFDILRKQGRAMNYKNVHTRIKKLEKYDLIEKIPGRFPRGAIKYQITDQGLFYQVSKRPEHELELLSLGELMDKYGDRIIFKTLLLPYFEMNTLRRATVLTHFSVVTYLGECCRVTLNTCDRVQEAIKENDNKYKAECIRELREDLQWTPKEFAFRLITKTPNKVMAGQLAKDKKFVKLVKDVKRDFDRGYDTIDSRS